MLKIKHMLKHLTKLWFHPSSESLGEAQLTCRILETLSTSNYISSHSEVCSLLLTKH